MVEREPIALNTTRRSLPHALGARLGWCTPGQEGLPSGDDDDDARPSTVLSWLLLVVPTYGLMVLATLGSTPRSAWFDPSPDIALPFLLDFNTAFMFLVSFPVVAALLVTDERELVRSLLTVQRDMVLVLNEDVSDDLTRWEKGFTRVNVVWGLVSVVIGAAVAAASYAIYSAPGLGHWVLLSGSTSPAAWVWLASLWLFWTTLSIYVGRVWKTISVLDGFVHASRISMLPAHPDKCGGLRPVGQLGLRNQLLLSILGLNVLFMFSVPFVFLTVPPALLALIVLAAFAYLTLGPFVFLGPLLPFRNGMQRAKSDLMRELAGRLRKELRRIRTLIPDGDITREDEELIERLRRVGALVEALPVWPFDAATLRKFLGVYVLPILGTFLAPFIASAIATLQRWAGLG